MPLLNYTTTVAVAKTVAQVHQQLVKAGARQVLATYDDDGEPAGLSFLIDTPMGRRSYSLPVNAEAVYKVVNAYHSGVPRRFQTEEQAHRIAWRILKDWLEAQLAIVETQMVAFDQVMLPYMHTDASRSTTVYDMVRSGVMGELEAGNNDG